MPTTTKNPPKQGTPKAKNLGCTLTEQNNRHSNKWKLQCKWNEKQLQQQLEYITKYPV